MNEFIRELSADYILDGYKIKKDVVVFAISSTRNINATLRLSHFYSKR